MLEEGLDLGGEDPVAIDLSEDQEGPGLNRFNTREEGLFPPGVGAVGNEV